MALGNLDDGSAPVSIDINNITIENNNRSGIRLNLFNSETDDPYRDQPDGSRSSAMANGTINIRNVDISKSNGTFSPFGISTAGNNNAGRLINGFKTESMRGRYAQLNGNGKVVAPNSSDINLGIHPKHTVSLWFRVDEFGAEKQVIYEQGGGSRGLNAYVDNDRLYVGGWNRRESG